MARFAAFCALFISISAIPGLFGQNSAWTINTLAGTNRPVNDGGPIAAVRTVR
jgi:hypothetical protein